MNKYTLDEIFTFQVREELVREFLVDCLSYQDDDMPVEAIKETLRYVTVPGEDYDGLLD